MGRRTLAFVCATLIATGADAGTPARDLYAAALAREKATRESLATSLPSPEILKLGRGVIAAYETIVRKHPASGYSDDALWQAGHLAIDLFSVFGEPRDRATGIRLLRLLASEYPTSKLARRAPADLEAIERRAEAPPPAAVPVAAPAIAAPAASGISRTGGSATPAAPGATVALATVTGVRRAVLPESVRITIELDREVPFHDERIDNPPRVFIDLGSTRAAAPLVDRTLRFDGDPDVVHQVRLGRHPSHITRIVLDAAGVAGYSVYALYNPFRLVIDCARTPALGKLAAGAGKIPPAPKPPDIPVAAALSSRRAAEWGRALPPALAPLPVAAVPTPAGHAATSVSSGDAALPATPPLHAPMPAVPTSNGYSIARQLGLGVSRIVIDPGHGGHDPGAKGKGVSEAELVLDVALRLEKLLQKVPGIEVILTRRTDVFVPLPERTAIANREGADLFLSIHANASSVPEARGIETYFLNFANNLSAAAVAARENAASGQTMGALPDFVKAIALNNKLDESRDFAGEVQRAMIERLRGPNKTLKNLGVKQAPFVVLIGAAMPSVLAEISFVTNPQEAKLLRGSAYRERIADALLNAIRRYQASLKAVTTVAHQ